MRKLGIMYLPTQDQNWSDWTTGGLLDTLDKREKGRIISARKATPHERREYEEGRF